MRSHVASIAEVQLDQAVEKAETLRNRRSREDRVAGSLGRDVLLFLLHLQDCECEKQAGMTSPGLFWLCLFVCGWVCRTPGLLTTGFSWLQNGKGSLHGIILEAHPNV